LKPLRYKKNITLFFLFFLQNLFISPDLLALDAVNNIEEYMLRIWSIETGLPQNTIQTLLQTNDGYIWIGTPSGLARFDGVRFKIYTRWNTPALIKDNILSLYEDNNKVLWIGTDGAGLYAYQNSIWRKYSTANGLSNNHINAITADWQGNLWVGTDYGLNRINEDGIKIFTTEAGLYDNLITSLTVDNWGDLWIGTFRGGLAKFRDKIIHVYDYRDGLTNLSVQALYVNQRGHLMIGTLEGLYYLDREGKMIYPVSGTSYTPITSIIKKGLESLWIGTMVDGIKQMKKLRFANQISVKGLPDDFVHCLLKDRDGNIWIGTDTAGLIQFKKKKIFNLIRDSGLPTNAVSAVMKDSKGNLWIGTRTKGLCKLKNYTVRETYNLQNGLSGNQISVLYEDNLQSLWIGTRDKGINRLRSGQLSQLTSKDGLRSNNITSVIQDKNQVVWIGTDVGLHRYSEGKIQLIEKNGDSDDLVINVLYETINHTLLVGTQKGLFKIIGDSLIRPDQQEIWIDDDVISLYEDRDGMLWIGTNGSGLKRWFNGELASLTGEQGLHDNYIFSITGDSHDNLWFSSTKGIFRIDRKNLLDFFNKKTFYAHSTYYDETDGMASRQCRSNIQPPVWKSDTGRLFYPTVSGVSVFDPDSIFIKSTTPEVIIEEVICGRDSLIDDRELISQISGDDIGFRFTAIDFKSPEKIRFEYKLKGFDDKYLRLDSHDNRFVEYSQLNPGQYQFLIRSINNEGQRNEKATIFAFEVKSPFYKNAVFLVFLLLVIVSASSGLVYLQHRRRIRKQIDKYRTSTLAPERADEIVSRLRILMEEEKIFLDPELSLRDLSERLKIHYNHISRIINENFKLSYNDFVNKYRIDEVKRKLADPEQKNKTVLELMYETGFYSKSVFNTAFKKFTGITPSKYRKKYL
jgi:ligand-binding sensor domain-containing protein/AraC-like DNA-binding protein